MNASRNIAMSLQPSHSIALVSHPDVMRWFLWSWNPCAGANLYESIKNMFEIIISTEIDITITNSTISIFKDYHMDISQSPPIIQALFTEMTYQKNKYFEKIENNYVFRNITCSKCKMNTLLNDSIDRCGWVTWAIYWILKSQPSKFFLMKDILSLSLIKIKDIKISTSKNTIPLPPWVEKYHTTIESIYKRLNQTIYYECFVS